MKIAMLCAAILSVAALASAETTIDQSPTGVEEAPPVAAPVTNFGPPTFDPATLRAYKESALQNLRRERDALLQPAPGETYDQAQLRQEKLEHTQNKIDRIGAELLTIP